MEKKVHMDLGGRPFTLETGRLAKQANAAVIVRYGDTVVLSTVTAFDSQRIWISFHLLSIMKKNFMP